MQEKYRRLGVFLGHAGDEEALAFVGRIGEIAQCETLIALYAPPSNVDENDELNDETARQFVHDHVPASLAERVTVQAERSNGLHRMLRIASSEQLDLIVVGRGLLSRRVAQSNTFVRLARKAPCDVLVVPQYAHLHLNRVMVAVDNSPYADNVLDVAVRFADGFGEGRGQVVAVSVYSVGYGWSKTGTSFDNARQYMETATRDDVQERVSRFNREGVLCETFVVHADNIEETLAELATVRNMDLICIGSHGAGGNPIALLGGTTERLLQSLYKPVLVVKQKGETSAFLESLLGRG